MVCPRCKHYKLKGTYQSRTGEARICRLCDKDEQTMVDWSLNLPTEDSWPIMWVPPDSYTIIDKL